MKKILILFLLFSINFQFLPALNTQNYKFIECELKPLIRNPNKIKTRKHSSRPHIPYKDTTSNSTNWSGYAAATNLNNPRANSVTQVHGTWKVPTISATPNNSFCSIWVGIDGFNSSSVEQLGTEHDWSNGKQLNYAWFEMYPNYAFEISKFPVSVGDSISASVVYKGNNIFILSMANNTKKIHTIIPTKYTTSKTALRSCAEWVVEAPFENTILPLAHFSIVKFSNCTATINDMTNAINKTQLFQNTSLNMVGNSGLKALTSALYANGKNFNVAWKGE